MRQWLPLIILASAQFVMVLDSSVMNVSISEIVADLTRRSVDAMTSWPGRELLRSANRGGVPLLANISS